MSSFTLLFRTPCLARGATGPSTPTPQRPSRRFVFVYALNILAAFAVVMLHTSLDVFNPRGTPHNWYALLAMQACFIFAVPVFFAISGMNLLNYRAKYDTRTFIVKRVRRVGVALLFGSAVCYLLYGIFPNSFWGAQDTVLSVKGFIKGFLSNTINDTYWFLYTIIGLYLLTPVLSLAANAKRLLQYILGCTFIASVLLPCAAFLGFDRAYLDPLFGWFAFSNVALLYFVGGYYIMRFIPADKGLLRSPVAMGALYVLATGTMYLVALTSNGAVGFDALPEAYNSFAVSIQSPLVIVQAFAIFQGFRVMEPKLRRLKRRGQGMLRHCANASLGVYLIHIPIINWLGVHQLPSGFEVLTKPIPKGVVVFISALIISMAWTAVLHGAIHLVSPHVSRIG